MVIKYAVRLFQVQADLGYSIGEAFYDGDIWTQNVQPEKWDEDVLNNYDYVAVFHANDYFIQNYGDIFGNKSDISDNSLFKVNRQSKCLERVE